jgi:hypothetical protein
MTAAAVFVVDSSDEDMYGDEVRVWDVYAGDDEGEPVTSHRDTVSFRSWGAALDHAERLAAKLGGVEVVTV